MGASRRSFTFNSNSSQIPSASSHGSSCLVLACHARPRTGCPAHANAGFATISIHRPRRSHLATHGTTISSHRSRAEQRRALQEVSIPHPCFFLDEALLIRAEDCGQRPLRGCTTPPKYTVCPFRPQSDATDFPQARQKPGCPIQPPPRPKPLGSTSTLTIATQTRVSLSCQTSY